MLYHSEQKERLLPMCFFNTNSLVQKAKQLLEDLTAITSELFILKKIKKTICA